ncbi:hypothetical protein PoB_000368100 [Plakobranchus ocellatus]|uniref:Uncharacterized protein n=1 Tax=Plakobranchus ocellatus TaxID=259542 RepID=A0AAV3Y254_9GAST|nr:hypothetical protein PoB_000368100 [Plakobranchus ocellatus]
MIPPSPLPLSLFPFSDHTAAGSPYRNDCLPLVSRYGRGFRIRETALRAVGTLLSRVRALPPASWPDGGQESLRSPCWNLVSTNPMGFGGGA